MKPNRSENKKLLRHWHFVWFFSLLIILQSLWLNSRLNFAFKMSPEVMQTELERKLAKELAKVPEAEIEEKLAKGGKLWFEPRIGEFGQDFEIEIWASVDELVDKVDLRIFYSPMDLEVLNLPDDEFDESVGLISISQELDEVKEGRFSLRSLQFRPKIEGETHLEFDFTKESLADCNLMNKDGKDILEEVGEGRYQIRISNF